MRETPLFLTPGGRRWTRAVNVAAFVLVALLMPAFLATCARDEDPGRRAMFPTWRVGEWWVVDSVMAISRPTLGAPLSGVDLRHRFTVTREDALDGVRCWVVEVIPAELHRDVKDRYDGKPVARLWVAQEQFRPLRVERWVGAGRDLVEPPRHEARADAAEGGPVLLDDALPTVLDLPVGPRSGQNSVSQPWRAGDFRDPTGRVVRQTVHEIVEKRGYWRERVLKVSLSDGAVACHQVWTPGRPWPESIRAWSGVEPRPPFVYETRLRVWSKRPYMAWLGTFFLIFGFAAQGLFTMRFVVQWIASERAGRSVIPMAFWYLSLSGGFMLLAYAVYRMDPVFIVGQSTGVLIYVRNVWFRLKERGAAAPKTDAGAPAEPAR